MRLCDIIFGDFQSMCKTQDLEKFHHYLLLFKTNDYDPNDWITLYK